MWVRLPPAAFMVDSKDIPKVIAEIISLRVALRSVSNTLSANKPLLTDDEACHYLIGRKLSSPTKFLQGLRTRCGLKSVMVGKYRMWPRVELDRYLNGLERVSSESLEMQRTKRKNRVAATEGVANV